ncbi:MAG: hypothetical protein IPK82_04885 [Polyangiaceae bacterium]|nr:hypothetical protein [Polyangiaceae bacterium]
MLETKDVIPSGSVPWAVSLVLTALLLLLVGIPLVFSVWRHVVYREQARLARLIEKKPLELKAGPVLLKGRVETEDGASAIVLEIDQVGREWQNKNNWSHEWKEKHRTVDVRPFKLRLPSGEVVQVIADDRVRIVDSLETASYKDSYRKRRAAIDNKETVWISGELSHEGQTGGKTGAYRAGPANWILRSPRTSRMEIASGSLNAQFEYWSRFYRLASLILMGLGTLFATVIVGPFLALTLFGQTEMTPILRTSTYTTTNKGKTYHHYVIHGQLGEKGRLAQVSDEVDPYLYNLATDKTVTKVPFVYVPTATWIHEVGTRPHLSLWRLIVGLFAGIMTFGFFWGLRKTAMPWYEQVQVTERGNGRLSSRVWHAQEPGKPGLYAERPDPKSDPSVQ